MLTTGVANAHARLAAAAAEASIAVNALTVQMRARPHVYPVPWHGSAECSRPPISRDANHLKTIAGADQLLADTVITFAGPGINRLHRDVLTSGARRAIPRMRLRVDSARRRITVRSNCAPLSASSLAEEVSWRGGLAAGVLRGAVDERSVLEWRPLVAAGTRPAGWDGVEARRQFVGGCLVVDPPAP